MVLPGIPKALLSKYSSEDAESVIKHTKLVKEAIKRKKGLIDGTLPEITEMGKRQDELSRIIAVMKEVEKEASSDALSNLLSLEVDLKDLLDSIKEEYLLVENFEKSKPTDFEKVQEGLEGDIAIGRIIEHQINLIFKLYGSCKEILNKLDDFKKEHAPDVGKVVENINDTASFISRIIMEEEVPNLAIAYRMLKLEEWPEIAKKIQFISTRFEELQPHQP